MLTVGSLFTGIGGLDLGLERAGMRVLWQCEADPYCRAVLRKHWPEVRCYEDIRELEHPPVVDVLCGGFPCQPVSQAGRRQAQTDARWLWPEFARLIRLLRPRYALMENVPGLLAAQQGRAAQEVFGDLAELGFDCEWASIPAAAVGATHLRYRVFAVAYARHGRGRAGDARADSQAQGSWAEDNAPAEYGGELAYANGSGCIEQRRAKSVFTPLPAVERGGWWESEPNVGRVAHGVPSRVDRLRALGNAVVPQVAEVIGRMILNAEFP